MSPRWLDVLERLATQGESHSLLDAVRVNAAAVLAKATDG